MSHSKFNWLVLLVQTSKGSTVLSTMEVCIFLKQITTELNLALLQKKVHSMMWRGVFNLTCTYTLMRYAFYAKLFYINDKVWYHLFKYPTVTVFWNVKPLLSLSSCSIPVSVASSSVNKTSVFSEKCKNRVTSPSNPPLRGLAPLHSLKAHTTWTLICQKERKQFTWNTGNPNGS